jgi:1,4-dihydroxy-2-naphthoyl-CoA synthase
MTQWQHLPNGIDIHWSVSERYIDINLLAYGLSLSTRIDEIKYIGTAVIPGGGGSVYLPLLVGRSRALEIIASSEDYDADTAERYGWINRAIPDAELDDFVHFRN